MNAKTFETVIYYLTQCRSNLIKDIEGKLEANKDITKTVEKAPDFGVSFNIFLTGSDLKLENLNRQEALDTIAAINTIFNYDLERAKDIETLIDMVKKETNYNG